MQETATALKYIYWDVIYLNFHTYFTGGTDGACRVIQAPRHGDIERKQKQQWPNKLSKASFSAAQSINQDQVLWRCWEQQCPQVVLRGNSPCWLCVVSHLEEEEGGKKKVSYSHFKSHFLTHVEITTNFHKFTPLCESATADRCVSILTDALWALPPVCLLVHPRPLKSLWAQVSLNSVYQHAIIHYSLTSSHRGSTQGESTRERQMRW